MPPAFGAEQWPRIARLFDEAAALPPDQRNAWLAGLQGHAPEVSSAVARLLAAHARHETGDWLAAGPQWRPDDDRPRPAGDATTEAVVGAPGNLESSSPTAADDARPGRLSALGLQPGHTVGRYRLQALVGQGGMGEVWRAQALDGPADRIVALKLPLLHRPDSAASARFAREAQILARLDHPHIARLLDAGRDAQGRPFLAMAWVTGRHLLEWADGQSLPLRTRLETFLQVLDAVAHAHSRLVIHRDLKPSNILVDGAGQARLLDFGIAKLLHDAQGAEPTALTRQAGRVLTTAYAAPEQVLGEVLTPATDVYALGVLLFELLTGERPYLGNYASEAQLEQAVAAADVRRPSALCPQWPRALRIDLDAIVGKALQRRPEDRYAGAREMADDLRRHLAGQPVVAQPPTAAYLARKFVQRHRTASVGAAVALVAVLAGSAATAWQAREAAAQRDRALAAQARSQATQQFLVDLLDDAARGGQPLTVAQLMDRAERLARANPQTPPDQRAAVLALVGADRADRDDPARGEALLAEAQALATHPELRAELACQQAFRSTYQRAPAEALARLRALAGDTELPQAVQASCRLVLGQLLIQNGNLDEARRWLDGLDRWLDAAGPTAWRRQTHWLTMQLYLRANHQARGLDARAAALAQRLAAEGRDRNGTALGLYNTWGTLAMVTGEPLRAVPRYAHVVQAMAQDHPQGQVPAYYLQMLANAQIGAGALDEAATSLARAAAAAEAQGPPSQRYIVACEQGRLAALRGDHDAAQAAFARARAVPDQGEALRRNTEPFCLAGQAGAALLAGQPQEAEPLLARLRTLPVPSASVRLMGTLLEAEWRLRRGDVAPARAEAEAALAAARALQADNLHSARTGQALALLALALHAAGDAAGARARQAEALTHLAATVRPDQRWRRVAEALDLGAGDRP